MLTPILATVRYLPCSVTGFFLNVGRSVSRTCLAGCASH